MQQIICTVKELFDVINGDYKYGKLFKLKKHNIQIKNEYNEYVKIKSLVLKKDIIFEVTFNDKTILKAGSNHRAVINKNTGAYIQLKNLKIGDYYETINNTKKSIIKIINTNLEKNVYDFEIDSTSHLYSTVDGLVHHNSAGIGKSYSVLDELRKEEANFVPISGGIKDAKSLYVILHKNNSPSTIIVFDDVNDIIRKRQNVEILRAAVTNELERKVTYFENKMIIDGIKSYHPWMTFKSKIIIITNIPKVKIDPAIISRTSPIEIIVNKYDIAPYIKENLENAPPQIAKLEWKEEAWDYITKELTLDNIKHLDFRVFEDVMLWVMACKNDDPRNDKWKKYAYQILT